MPLAASCAGRQQPSRRRSSRGSDDEESEQGAAVVKLSRIVLRVAGRGQGDGALCAALLKEPRTE